MEGSKRVRIVALAVLLAISVPLVVIAVAGGGSGDEESEGLRVERSPQGLPEVVIYLEDPGVNDPATNGGRTRVRVQCSDSGGAVIFRGSERWPLSDTDGGRFDPHVHVAIERAVLDRVTRCRFVGTDPPLEGRKV